VGSSPAGCTLCGRTELSERILVPTQELTRSWMRPAEPELSLDFRRATSSRFAITDVDLSAEMRPLLAEGRPIALSTWRSLEENPRFHNRDRRAPRQLIPAAIDVFRAAPSERSARPRRAGVHPRYFWGAMGGPLRETRGRVGPRVSLGCARTRPRL
jgi:hypothetical protein